MSVAAQTLNDPARRSADLRLAVIGAISVLFSITAFAAGMLGKLPTGLSTETTQTDQILPNTPKTTPPLSSGSGGSTGHGTGTTIPHKPRS